MKNLPGKNAFSLHVNRMIWRKVTKTFSLECDIHVAHEDVVSTSGGHQQSNVQEVKWIPNLWLVMNIKETHICLPVTMIQSNNDHTIIHHTSIDLYNTKGIGLFAPSSSI